MVDKLKPQYCGSRRGFGIRTHLLSLLAIFLGTIVAGQGLNTTFDVTQLDWSDQGHLILRKGENSYQLHGSAIGPWQHFLGHDYQNGVIRTYEVDSMGSLVLLGPVNPYTWVSYPAGEVAIPCMNGGYLKCIHRWDLADPYGRRYLTRTDEQGMDHWVVDLTGRGRFKAMKELDAGGFLVLLSTSFPDTSSLLILLDIYGDEILNTPLDRRLDKLLETSNGDYFLAGSTGSELDFCGVSPNGEILFETALDQGTHNATIGLDISPIGNTSFLVQNWSEDGTGTVRELSISPVGEVFDQIVHDTLASGTSIVGHVRAAQGDVLCYGRSYLSEFDQSGFIQRTSADGSLQWKRTYRPIMPGVPISSGIFSDLEAVSGTAFLALGTRQYQMQGNSPSDVWLARIYADGCIVPGCDGVGITEQATNLLDAISLAPNPASEQVTIQLDLPASVVGKALQLSIVGSDGRVVLQEQVASGTRALSLSVATLSAGLYHVHITNGTSWLTGAKLVVE